MQPETRYAESSGLYIAYQVFGEGPIDLVYVAEFWNSIDVMWDQPDFRRYLERLGSFARVIAFDQRGTGLSDPVALTALPTIEEWADDIRAVMAAAGSTQAALLGTGGGGAMSMVFAATHPAQTRALVLLNTGARVTRAPDYPYGTSDEFEDRFVRDLKFGWGRGVLLEAVAPTKAGDPEFRTWWARYQRVGVSLGAVLAQRQKLQQVDVRGVLPAISVPTLILHRRDNRVIDLANGRYLAEQIPGARLVDVPGDDYLPFVGDQDAILDEIQAFLTGSRATPEPDRMLATVMFTDIVGATERAAALGDHAWRELIDRHHAIVRRELDAHRGREVDTAGDGFLAMFDGPARAVRCALAVRDGLRPLGLEIRAGLHTGEVELAEAEVRGLAVHIGARVAGLAEPGEVMVSSTVRDLVAGSGLVFEDRGMHALKGVPEEWHLYAVTSG
jgi:class 3 adenylate cyclase/pimeloyl-ACP methyl ester carboxylesterase